MRKTLNRGTLLVFAIVLLIFATGCARPALIVHGDEGIESIKQGEPAPFDGFVLTPLTYQMLFEAAELGATTQELQRLKK